MRVASDDIGARVYNVLSIMSSCDDYYEEKSVESILSLVSLPYVNIDFNNKFR
jgi:hypothetical protein